MKTYKFILKNKDTKEIEMTATESYECEADAMKHGREILFIRNLNENRRKYEITIFEIKSIFVQSYK